MIMIKKEDIVSKAVYMHGFGKNKYVPLNAIEKAEVIDAVPRSVYEQVCWERDIAINQLEEIGISFGEKTDGVKRVIHGYWIFPTVIGGRAWNIPHCSVCDGVPCGTDENTKYCANCGAKMDLKDGDNNE